MPMLTTTRITNRRSRGRSTARDSRDIRQRRCRCISRRGSEEVFDEEDDNDDADAGPAKGCLFVRI